MNDSAVDFWLSAAGRVPLLTAKQEVMYGRAVRAWLDHPDPPPDVVRRGLRARDRMLTANLRLVVALARRFHGPLQQRGLTMADGLQEGTLGLLRGVEKFDPTRGYKFSTYAYWWIRQGISRAIEMAGLIRLPVDLQQHVRRGLSEAEWTAATDSYRERFQCVQAAHSISSLDARLGGNDREGSAMVDLIVDQRDIDSRRDEEEASAIEALIAEAREAVNGYEWSLVLKHANRQAMPETAKRALTKMRLRLGIEGVA